jgi:hypothetical protein
MRKYERRLPHWDVIGTPLFVTFRLHGSLPAKRIFPPVHAFVVMPNHVHMLVTPSVVATRWLGPLKGFTSYQANELLGTLGRPSWQDESYDHLVRDGVEFERIRVYIQQNPVTAGLVIAAERFQWSSARNMPV